MRRLLIVDDERDMLDFLERVFRREYEVLRAQSVEEAERALDGGAARRDRHRPAHAAAQRARAARDRRRSASRKAVRVLLTGYADSLVDEKVDAVATGRRLGLEADRLGRRSSSRSTQAIAKRRAASPVDASVSGCAEQQDRRSRRSRGRLRRAAT